MQQKLRLTALILGWYVLNTMYNIGNKLVLTAFPSERPWPPNPNPNPTPNPTPNPSHNSRPNPNPDPKPNPDPNPDPDPNPAQCRGRRRRGSSSSASRTSSSCGPPACARPLSSAGRASSYSHPRASSSQALELYLLYLHLLWLTYYGSTEKGLLTMALHLLWSYPLRHPLLAGTHVGGVISFGLGAISFTHVLKATEPVWSALISAIVFRDFLPLPVACRSHLSSLAAPPFSNVTPLPRTLNLLP